MWRVPPMQAVPKLDNVVVNVRDAGGAGKTTREFLLVFPGIVTNVRTSEVMRMVEHQLRKKFHQHQLGQRAETRLVLAGAGMTVVQHVGGRFELGGPNSDEAVYVQDDDDSTAITLQRAYQLGPGSVGNATLEVEPIQWKTFSGCSGLTSVAVPKAAKIGSMAFPSTTEVSRYD